MKTEHQIILLLFIHWVADFLLQNESMAKNKSKSNGWLLLHVLTYSFSWLFIGAVLYFYNEIFTVKQILAFVYITFVCHFTTDYLTSRWTSKLYKDSKFYGFPSFFSVIGFDQWLHFAQLILTLDYIRTL